MATLNLTIPTATLNYAGAGTGPSATRHVPGYTDQRIVWFKGVDNVLTLNIVGSDRKPVSLLRRELTITMWDRETGSTIFRRRALPTVAEDGMAKVVILARDLMTLGSGIYALGATFVDAEGFETALTWNRAMQGAFDVEVKDAVVPTSRQSAEITEYVNIGTDSQGVDKFVSGSMNGPSFFRKDTSLFSVAVYASNWTGTLIIQGTMDENITTSTLWADLKPQDTASALLEYNGYTGIDPFNYYAGVRWLRIRRIESPSNAGTLDKVVVRV